MGCNSCKKKPSNTIKNLQSEVDIEKLTLAFNYVAIASKMDNQKWDLVEEVINDLYPSRHPLNRQCKDCLRQAAQLIQHEYNKRQ